jgi:hypothetical protein
MFAVAAALVSVAAVFGLFASLHSRMRDES